MTTNAYVRLQRLLPPAPVWVGKVLAHYSDDTSLVELPTNEGSIGIASGLTTGSRVRVRGTTVAVGSRAFIRNGVIETQAPDGAPVEHAVGVVKDLAEPLVFNGPVPNYAQAIGLDVATDYSHFWAGGVSPLYYKIAAGQVPEGVTFGVDGVMRGTPTAVGDSVISIAAVDSSGIAVKSNSFRFSVVDSRLSGDILKFTFEFSPWDNEAVYPTSLYGSGQGSSSLVNGAAFGGGTCLLLEAEGSTEVKRLDTLALDEIPDQPYTSVVGDTVEYEFDVRLIEYYHSSAGMSPIGTVSFKAFALPVIDIRSYDGNGARLYLCYSSWYFQGPWDHMDASTRWVDLGLLPLGQAVTCRVVTDRRTVEAYVDEVQACVLARGGEFSEQIADDTVLEEAPGLTIQVLHGGFGLGGSHPRQAVEFDNFRLTVTPQDVVIIPGGPT